MSHATTPCRLCTNEAGIIPAEIGGEHRRCRRCGEYKISSTAINMIGGRPEDDKSRISLSGWVRNQNALGDVPFITSNVLKNIGGRALPSVAERADLLLIEVVRSQSSLSDWVELGRAAFVSASYSQNVGEVYVLAEMLCQQGLTRMSSAQPRHVYVNFEGHSRADELVKRPSNSATAFVAMRFADDLDEAYDRGINVAVLNAGYDPVRVDRTEHVNRIDDEIIALIRPWTH